MIESDTIYQIKDEKGDVKLAVQRQGDYVMIAESVGNLQGGLSVGLDHNFVIDLNVILEKVLKEYDYNCDF